MRYIKNIFNVKLASSIILVLCGILPFCNAGCSHQQKNTVSNTTASETGNALWSADMLSGTRWVRYIDEEEVLYLNFAERSYGLSSVNPRESLATSVSRHLYYLSEYKPTRFDSSKVGKNTRGEFIITDSYRDINNSEPVIGNDEPTRIIAITPTELILEQKTYSGKDTIVYNRMSDDKP